METKTVLKSRAVIPHPCHSMDGTTHATNETPNDRREEATNDVDNGDGPSYGAVTATNAHK